eukprot:1011781-Pelagomonas_calceolata.AAC.2
MQAGGLGMHGASSSLQAKWVLQVVCHPLLSPWLACGNGARSGSTWVLDAKVDPLLWVFGALNQQLTLLSLAARSRNAS